MFKYLTRYTLKRWLLEESLKNKKDEKRERERTADGNLKKKKSGADVEQTFIKVSQ